MPVLNDATAIYVGSTPATRVYLGSDIVWEAVQPPAGSPEHQVFDGSYPGTLSRFTDGGSNIVLANGFYRSGEVTHGWRVVGGRLLIPAAELANLPATATISLYSARYSASGLSTPALNGAALRSEVVTLAAGWNEVRWDPYTVDVGANEVVWIAYTFGNGNYLFLSDPYAGAAHQAADGSALYLTDSAPPTQARGAFSIDGADPGLSNHLYGVDIIFDEGPLTDVLLWEDDFERADATGVAAVGNGWISSFGDGGLSIVGGALRRTGSGYQVDRRLDATPIPSSMPVAVEIDVADAQVGNYWGIGARMNNADAFRVHGVRALLGASPTTLTIGDSYNFAESNVTPSFTAAFPSDWGSAGVNTLRMELRANDCRVYANGTHVATADLTGVPNQPYGGNDRVVAFGWVGDVFEGGDEILAIRVYQLAIE